MTPDSCDLDHVAEFLAGKPIAYFGQPLRAITVDGSTPEHLGAELLTKGCTFFDLEPGDASRYTFAVQVLNGAGWKHGWLITRFVGGHCLAQVAVQGGHLDAWHLLPLAAANDWSLAVFTWFLTLVEKGYNVARLNREL